MQANITYETACEISYNEFIKMGYQPWICGAGSVPDGWVFLGQSTESGGTEYGNVPLKVYRDGRVVQYDTDENWEEYINLTPETINEIYKRKNYHKKAS